MTHPERRQARSIDCPGRAAAFTDLVYQGKGGAGELHAELGRINAQSDPPPPGYKVLIGDMHGHTNLSDGRPDIDSYFRSLRDKARVDFAAISDHDHGGVGRPCLWEGSPSKWDLIREKVRAYDQPGVFTTLLAYERDSYPYYVNLVIYYASDDGELFRGVRDGELTSDELRALLARDDVIVVPHDTYSPTKGADFTRLPLELHTPFLEIYSRGDACEYWDNPGMGEKDAAPGGFWQDALKRGSRMGVIGGSDDHSCQNGLTTDAPYPDKYPGLTGVWAASNTRADIFAALKARRTFAFMGGRMEIDFRINGHWMGEQITLGADEDVALWYDVKADAAIRRVTVVKNCRDAVRICRAPRQLLFDYRREQETDVYYLRVELEDGRFGWTSPIWVSRAWE